MRLSELVRRELPQDPEITGVTADSRRVKPGYLFAALPGAQADGRAVVSAALKAGAAAVIAGEAIEGVRAPVVEAWDPRRAYALAAAAFWNAQPKVCVAVTGTNGKTSVAGQVIERIAPVLGVKRAAVVPVVATRDTDQISGGEH